MHGGLNLRVWKRTPKEADGGPILVAFKLTGSEEFASGVAVHTYEPAG